jgi:hypothetical protein
LNKTATGEEYKRINTVAMDNTDNNIRLARTMTNISAVSSPSATAISAAGLPSYPMPAYLKFMPGGLSNVKSDNGGNKTEQPSSDMYLLSTFSENLERSSSSSSGGSTPRSRGRSSSFLNPLVGVMDNGINGKINPASTTTGSGSHTKTQSPDWLVHKAKLADDRLNSYIRYYVGTSGANSDKKEAPVFLPSLSILANAAFGRLTGVPPARARSWADAMILQYYDKMRQEDLSWPQTEEEVLQEKPSAMKHVSGSRKTTVSVLKNLLEEEHAAAEGCLLRPRRPCGYVFKRGDIAWNCRTCQTDSTCVICDACFRSSDHEGHEVYFHRTTPGGCCDCGDAEAWKIEGCCPSHRPLTSTASAGEESKAGDGEADPEEAVRMALRGRKDGLETLQQSPTKLPPRLAAALGVVIGAAVRCLVEAVDGAGVGADPVQWKLRWADEACRIWNGAAETDDFYKLSSQPLSKSFKTPSDFLSKVEQCFPGNFRLQLRLHNDDVHTFDEVIDALRTNSNHRGNPDGSQAQPLVARREDATEMTHHVDADGQVTVKTFSTIQSAMEGYKRLKSKGLHCAVVSTAQTDMELRARNLSTWLSEISSAHPSAAVLVVHALLQIKSTQDLGGISVWQEARSIPAWLCPNEHDEVQACRKRFQVFPPHLATSYVTGDEAEKLHKMAMNVDAKTFLEMTGEFGFQFHLVFVTKFFSVSLITQLRQTTMF